MKVSGPNAGSGLGPADGSTGAPTPDATSAAEGQAPAAATGEVGATEASAQVQRADSTGRAFAEKLAAAGAPPAGTTGPAATTRAAETHATAGIATDLKAGRLTPAAAVDKVLEQVLARQVGSDAPAAVRERVRAALQEALENDPLLAEKLRRLEA